MNQAEWGDLIEWLLKALLGGVCTYGVRILAQMRESIDQLNHKVATMIERAEWHSKELERMDERLTSLEKKIFYKNDTSRKTPYPKLPNDRVLLPEK